MSKWVKIREIVPKYEKPGKLREYRLELLCYEIQEKVAYPQLCSRDLRIDLCLQIGIENSDKEWHRVYPNFINTSRPIRLHDLREEEKEIKEIRFGGG